MIHHNKTSQDAFENGLCNRLIDIYHKETKIMAELGFDPTYRKTQHPSDSGQLLLTADGGMMPMVSPIDVYGTMLANKVAVTQYNFDDMLYNHVIPVATSLQGAATGLGLMLLGLFASHYFTSEKPEQIQTANAKPVTKNNYYQKISYLHHLDLQRYDITFMHDDVFGKEPHYRYATTPALHRQNNPHLYKID